MNFLTSSSHFSLEVAMSTAAVPNDFSLQQLCNAAIREKDPVKRWELIEEIDRRFDEDHKRSSLKRSLRERAA
jgi:hypothetical protein